MEVEVSKYKNNEIATKKKHLFARLLDYFITFVVAYIMFNIVTMVANSIPSIQNITAGLQSSKTDVINYILDSHLRSESETKGELASVSVDIEYYLDKLARTNAYVYELPYRVKNSDGTISEYIIEKDETFIDDLVTYEFDRLSYYYKIFKKNEEGLNEYIIDDVDYKDDIDTYLYIKIMSYTASLFVESLPARAETASKYLIFTSENAQKFIARVGLKETTDESANALYNMVSTGYNQAVQKGSEQIEGKSVRYAQLSANFTAWYQKLSNAILVIYFIGYVITYLLLTILPRLIHKEWTTVGQKVMNIGINSKDEMDVKWWQLTLYHVINFILFFSSIVIAFYFMGMFGALSLYITPHITLLALIIAILTFNLISLFMILFNKKNHDLSTFIIGILFKDKNEYVTSPDAMAAIENQQSNDGNNQ